VDHRCGWFVKRGILAVDDEAALLAWLECHDMDVIFNDLASEDVKQEGERVSIQQRYQSRVPFARGEAGVPPGVDLEKLEHYFHALRYEVVPKSIREGAKEYFGGYKAITTDPAPEGVEPCHQIPHSDHGTPRLHWRYEPGRAMHLKGSLCSVLLALQPSEVDIWETRVVLERDKRKKFPQHPKAVPKVTVHLEPGDILVFRFDLVHAGRGYRSKDNLRLFFTVSPFAGSTVLIDDESTYYDNCECMAHFVKAAQKHKKRIPRVTDQEDTVDEKGKIVKKNVWNCQCPPRTNKGPSHEEWMKVTGKNNLF